MTKPPAKKPRKAEPAAPATPKTPQTPAPTQKRPPGRPRKSKPAPGKENVVPSSPLGTAVPALGSDDAEEPMMELLRLRQRVAELEAVDTETTGAKTGNSTSSPLAHVEEPAKKKAQATPAKGVTPAKRAAVEPVTDDDQGDQPAKKKAQVATAAPAKRAELVINDVDDQDDQTDEEAPSQPARNRTSENPGQTRKTAGEVDGGKSSRPKKKKAPAPSEHQ